MGELCNQKKKTRVVLVILPDELVEEILLRLPALSSLLRFKAVCKQWRDLISSPRFIKQHVKVAVYNHTIGQINLSGYPRSYTVKPPPTPPHQTLHLNADDQRFYTFAEYALCTARLTSMRHAPEELPWYVAASSSSSSSSSSNSLRAVEIFNPFHIPLHLVKVLGSCNGLLLVLLHSSMLCVWNPATRQSFVTGCQPRKIGVRGKRFSIAGLGYTSALDEYNAVSLSVCYNSTTGFIPPQFKKSQLLVYSSRTGCRKEVHGFNLPYCFCNKRCCVGLTVNGFPHWTVHDHGRGKSSTNDLILYFDIASSADENYEKCFKKVPTPSAWSEYYDSSPELAHLQRCLCVALDNSPAHSGLDVWIMKEYGVVESWTKLFVINHPPSRACRRAYVPLGFTNNADEVVMKAGGKKIVTYNLKTGRMKLAFGTTNVKGLKSFEYVASLVPPWYV